MSLEMTTPQLSGQGLSVIPREHISFYKKCGCINFVGDSVDWKSEVVLPFQGSKLRDGKYPLPQLLFTQMHPIEFRESRLLKE